MPNSEQPDSITNKMQAYDLEKDAKRTEERIKQESVVKNSDFFNKLSNDNVENNKINKDEDIEDYYQRTVVEKVGKKETKTNFYNIQPKTLNSYTVNDADEEPIYPDILDTKEKNTEKIKTKGNNSLQSRITKRENTEVYNEESENDPTNYNRSRKQTSNQTNTTKTFIKACIHEDQVATDGSAVAMRTLEECKINGVTIPRNTLFYGTTSISQDRMNIKVQNLKYKGQMMNVNFAIYDNDAIQGLNLPDNIKSELAKKTKDAGIDQLNIETGSTGIIQSSVKGVTNVVKSVFKKDNSQTKVNLKANYQLFILQKN